MYGKRTDKSITIFDSPPARPRGAPFRSPPGAQHPDLGPPKVIHSLGTLRALPEAARRSPAHYPLLPRDCRGCIARPPDAIVPRQSRVSPTLSQICPRPPPRIPGTLSAILSNRVRYTYA